jgi:hypothetical protein
MFVLLMKRHLLRYFAVLCVAYLLAPDCVQVAKYVHFLLNPDSFVEVYCQNRDKPELNCKGACALKSTNSFEISPDNEQPSPVSIPSELGSNFSFSLFFESSQLALFTSNRNVDLVFFLQLHHSKEVVSQQLRPPIFS